MPRFIVSSEGDLRFFDSLDDAMSWIEAPDVLDGSTRLFDEDGAEYRLGVGPKQGFWGGPSVVVEEVIPTSVGRRAVLSLIIQQYLSVAGHRLPGQQTSLPDLIREACEAARGRRS